MNFNDAMVAVRASAAPTVNIPEQWGQGRATFGGMLAAVLFEKVATQVAQDRPIRSVLLSFIAPVAPGAMEVQVKVLREGRGATQVQATAYQNDQACAVLLASFGGDRESMLNVAQERAPAFTAPDEVQAFPFIPGLTPDFTQYFDYRYTLGKMPFMGSEQTTMGGWIKLREDSPQAISVAAILALIGYSNNETIVIFDRVRENLLGQRRMEILDVVNLSVNQTLLRSVITHLTTLLVLSALLIVGGKSVHSFASALAVGVIVATYSSIYVSTGTAVLLGISREDLLPPERSEIDEMP